MLPIERLAMQLDSLREEVRDLTTTPQLAKSAIVGGAIDQVELVDTGQVDQYGQPVFESVLVARYGAQSDGSNTAVSFSGPKPPRPTAPQVEAGPGFMKVTWTGEFVDRVEPYMDHDYVAIHVGTTEGFTPSADTLMASIRSPAGETVLIGLAPGSYYVSLVSVSTAGMWSDPAPYSPGAPGEASAIDVTAREAAAAADAKATAAQTTADQAIADAAAAQGDATAAQTAATAAATLANGKSTIVYAPTEPAGTAWRTDDLWFDTDDQNKPYGWDGTAWVARPLGDAALSSLSAGKIVSGTLGVGQIITVGDPLATHLDIGNSQINVYRVDEDGVLMPEPTLTLGGASADAIRLADAEGLERVSLNAGDGSVDADEIRADKIILRGTTVTSMIDLKAEGVVGHGYRAEARGVTYSPGTEYGMWEVSAPVVSGRVYMLRSLNHINQAAGGRLEIFHRYTMDDTQPVVSSALAGPERSIYPSSGGFQTYEHTSILRVSAGQPGDVFPLRFLSSLKPTTQNATVGAAGTAFQAEQTIIDMGKSWDGNVSMSKSSGGVAGGDVPPTTKRTVTWAGDWSRSWKGSSVSETGSYLRHGVYGTAQKSMLGFPAALTTAIAGSTIQSVRVYLYSVHWWFNAGGSTNMGAHGATSAPGSFSRNGSYSQQVITWTSKTGGKWITLPSAWHAGILSGAIRGITFGDGDSGTGSYGYFDGNLATGNSNRPMIEVTYTK